jgi:hypothetical protein
LQAVGVESQSDTVDGNEGRQTFTDGHPDFGHFEETKKGGHMKQRDGGQKLNE